MAPYTRPDSRFYWLCLERPGQLPLREPTKIPVDGGTTAATRANKKLAQAAYAARMGDLARRRYELPAAKPQTTFAKYRVWYAEHHSAHKRNTAREKSMLAKLGQTFDPYRLDQIDRRLCLEWRTARAKQVTPGTVNRERDLLRHVLGTAIPEYLDENPAAGLKSLRIPDQDIRILSHEEERLLLAVCAPEDQAIVLCAIDTLMRLQNVASFKRAQDHGMYITVLNPKVREYKVPVSSRLRAALQALPENGPYYFPSLQGDGSENARRNRTIRRFHELLVAAGLPTGRKTGGLSFHCLRHTGASRMLAKGVDIKTVQLIGGWADLGVLQRYLHPTDAAKVAAVESVSRE